MSRSTMNYNGWSTIGGTSPEQVEQELPFPTDVIAESENMYLTELLWDEGGKWDTLTALAKEAPAGSEILVAGLDVVEMLLEKNISYGNSAIEPLRLFSKANNEEQIYVRVDDKLSRLKNNQTYPGDNDIDDLIGYLILLKVARRKNA